MTEISDDSHQKFVSLFKFKAGDLVVHRANKRYRGVVMHQSLDRCDAAFQREYLVRFYPESFTLDRGGPVAVRLLEVELAPFVEEQKD